MVHPLIVIGLLVIAAVLMLGYLLTHVWGHEHGFRNVIVVVALVFIGIAGYKILKYTDYWPKIRIDNGLITVRVHDQGGDNSNAGKFEKTPRKDRDHRKPKPAKSADDEWRKL